MIHGYLDRGWKANLDFFIIFFFNLIKTFLANRSLLFNAFTNTPPRHQWFIHKVLERNLWSYEQNGFICHGKTRKSEASWQVPNILLYFLSLFLSCEMIFLFPFHRLWNLSEHVFNKVDSYFPLIFVHKLFIYSVMKYQWVLVCCTFLCLYLRSGKTPHNSTLEK